MQWEASQVSLVNLCLTDFKILRFPWDTFHISVSCPHPFITEHFESALQYFPGKPLKAKEFADNSLIIREDVLCSAWLQHLGMASCKAPLKFSLVNREVMLRSQGGSFHPSMAGRSSPMSVPVCGNFAHD